jgi:hypothetical protein
VPPYQRWGKQGRRRVLPDECNCWLLQFCDFPAPHNLDSPLQHCHALKAIHMPARSHVERSSSTGTTTTCTPAGGLGCGADEQDPVGSL